MLGPARLVVFDADGTLRRTTVPGQPCPRASDQWELLPDETGGYYIVLKRRAAE